MLYFPSYSQNENTLIDLMIQSYEMYYSLSKPKSTQKTNQDKVCPSMPDSATFYKDFRENSLDLQNYLSNIQITKDTEQERQKRRIFKLTLPVFSFEDIPFPPLKGDLVVTSTYDEERVNQSTLTLAYHEGVDFGLRGVENDTVYSVFCGVVRFVRHVNVGDTIGFGNVVVIRNFNMSEALYAHLETIFVTSGQEVKAGDPIGIGGNTGKSSGPHLHFELRFQKYSRNPIINNKFLGHFDVKKK
jgi:murein DD-endopeptidase MepM/ murein hydrolase activator NlpD